MPNERQLATLIWFGVIAVAVLLHPRTRSSLRDVATTAAHLKIVIPVLALVTYVGGLVYGGWRIGAWTSEMTTDTSFWFVGSALVLLFNIDRVSKSERFFRRTALGTVGVTALTEFFVNDLFVFSLPVEFFLLPVLSLLIMTSVVAERTPEHAQVKRLLEGVLAAVGIGLAIYIGLRLISDWATIDKLAAARSFALPLWLLLGVLPFIYLMSVYSNYEVAFKWVDFDANGGRSRWRAKLALVLRLNGHVRDVGAFTVFWGREAAEATSFREAWRVVGRFRASRREARCAEEHKRDRLERYAGVDGVDDEGQRLDQREFKETKASLQALATAQMGWYRNRGGRYRPELREILASRFERERLPKDHGIELHVAEDGQSWWAWRRTVTGWCFAVGAAGPPPDEWLYDGPEPPKGFPGDAEGWSQWGADVRNW